MSEVVLGSVTKAGGSSALDRRKVVESVGTSSKLGNGEERKVYTGLISGPNLLALGKENCILEVELLRGELQIWLGVETVTDILCV